MWDLTGPGHEPVSPASAGGFLTTAPPGKSRVCIFELANLRAQFTSATNRAYDILMKTKHILGFLMTMLFKL